VGVSSSRLSVHPIRLRSPQIAGFNIDMPIQIRDTDGTLRTIKAVSVRDNTNTLKTIRFIKVRDAGNVERLVFDGFTASASPTAVSGSGNSPSGITISTGPSSVTVTGGVAPYTYSWTKVSGISGWSAISPTSASSSFRCSGVIAGDTETSTWHCTVTDAASGTAVSNTISAQVTNTNSS
jgi:hypothetical protein